MKLTDHFHLEEVTVTSHKEVSNDIPTQALVVASHTAIKMEDVRRLLGDNAISVLSWYRSPSLNKIVGGSKNSQHMRGEAVDFICPGFGTPYEICKLLSQKKLELGIDQLIFEQTWVHISFVIPPMVPRLEVLTYTPEKKYVSGVVFTPLRG